MALKILYSLGVLIIAIIVCVLLGNVLQQIQQATIQAIGKFLVDFAGLIGILCGLWYFVWGYRPLAR